MIRRGQPKPAHEGPWKHDDLAADLARHLRRVSGLVCFLNVTIPLPEDTRETRPRFSYAGRPLPKTAEERDAERAMWAAYRDELDAWAAAHREGRPDVFAFTPTYTAANQRPKVFEIKVTRSDFLSDVRADKWRKYLHVGGQVYFATPAGLVTRDEIPKGAGLIERSERAWKYTRRAPVHERRGIDARQALALALACHSQLAGIGLRSGDAV